MSSRLLVVAILFVGLSACLGLAEITDTSSFKPSKSLVSQTASKDAHVSIKFRPSELKMLMHNTSKFDYTLIVDKTAFTQETAISILLKFQLITLSPQLDIIEFTHPPTSNFTTYGAVNLFENVNISADQLRKDNYVHNSTLYLRSTYIGHAVIRVESDLLKNDGTNESLIVAGTGNKRRGRGLLDITIIRNEGILDKIFMYSVIAFITISYINLGAQIDTENVRRLIETPKIIFLGLLIGIVVMPFSSYLAGHLLFQDQPMYRVGSFIYACAPAASASVLWTVMFDADKELALGLQISSTVGALITMPIFLYAMDKSIDLEGQYTIKVPYLNLTRTLVVLLVALLIGSRLVGRYKRARQISQRIFRPLTMFVLLFIIIFSSIVYWYVYRMFNLRITLMAFVVTCATYIFSGLLGYIINRDINEMITISISSTYRNSGIAFAALVVAFQPPDIFIAYVPCLTQVVTTSLIGLVFYTLKSLRNHFSRVTI